MGSGANDRPGFVQRIREARHQSRGPFTGAHVCQVLEEEGYRTIDVDDDESFRLYCKEGCKPVPVNRGWRLIWDRDPTFLCLQRDLGFSRSRLRTRLNEARNYDSNHDPVH
jgi:hypothetical protein